METCDLKYEICEDVLGCISSPVRVTWTEENWATAMYGFRCSDCALIQPEE